MDKIVLKGLHFYGYHGVFPEETRKGQPFSVDVTLEFDASRAEETDSINETVDYSAVYGTIQKIVEGDPYKLIEKVAAVIAWRAPTSARRSGVRRSDAPQATGAY